jgi:hypothetical protein
VDAIGTRSEFDQRRTVDGAGTRVGATRLPPHDGDVIVLRDHARHLEGETSVLDEHLADVLRVLLWGPGHGVLVLAVQLMGDDGGGHEPNGRIRVTATADLGE